MNARKIPQHKINEKKAKFDRKRKTNSIEMQIMILAAGVFDK